MFEDIRTERRPTAARLRAMRTVLSRAYSEDEGWTRELCISLLFMDPDDRLSILDYVLQGRDRLGPTC